MTNRSLLTATAHTRNSNSYIHIGLIILRSMSAVVLLCTIVASATSSEPVPTARRARTLVPPVEMTRADVLSAAAGAAGLMLGWSVTPTKTDPMAGGVRTAEAWRRKIKARRNIPLLVRSPRILLVSMLCYSAAEYSLAFPTHGALGSAKRMHVVRCGINLATGAYQRMPQPLRGSCQHLITEGAVVLKRCAPPGWPSLTATSA